MADEALSVLSAAVPRALSAHVAFMHPASCGGSTVAVLHMCIVGLTCVTRWAGFVLSSPRFCESIIVSRTGFKRVTALPVMLFRLSPAMIQECGHSHRDGVGMQWARMRKGISDYQAE